VSQTSANVHGRWVDWGNDLIGLIRGWWMFEVSECDEEDVVDDEWRMMTHV